MDSPNTIEALYHKEPYIVFLTDIDVEYAGGRYHQGYAVLNTDTGIVEFNSPSLPDCLSLATQSAAALHFFCDNGSKGDIDTSMLDGEETRH